MSTSWRKFNVGSSHIVYVKLEHVQDSDPCNKDNCMLTRAVVALLLSMYGETFKVKSTNHGLVLNLKGRRITFVFDTNTAKKIYTYDRVFKKTHSRTAAWGTVTKGFKSKLMVESNIVTPQYPPMSEETKTKLAEDRLKRRAREKKLGIPRNSSPTREGTSRELSL